MVPKRPLPTMSSKSGFMASIKCTSRRCRGYHARGTPPAVRRILNALGVAFSSTLKIFTCWNARPAIAHPLGARPAPIGQKPQRLRLGVVERGRGERAAHDRRGIEVEAAAAQIGRAGPQRRVAVHDEAAAIDLGAIGPARLP